MELSAQWQADSQTSGYIDLSKRRVSAEDIIKCEERFNKGKMVASIMRHVAEKTRTPMETLYQSIGWPLNKKYGHAVDAFKLSITYDVHPPFSPFDSLLIVAGIPTYGQKSNSPPRSSNPNYNPISPNVSPRNQPKSEQTSK